MSFNGPAKEIPSHKIFVGGLDLETTEEDLSEYFSKFGKVVERLIKVDIKSKKSRGFGFIGFKTPESIVLVLELGEHFIRGKKIDCKRAMTKEEAYSLNKNLKDSCRKVFVSNIPRDTSKAELTKLFNQYGRVAEVNLMFKKKETGFCYLIYEREEEAIKLIEQKYIEFKGSQLEAKKALPKDLKDLPEDDSRGKASTNHYDIQMPVKHRHSFDTPISYHTPYYGNPNTLSMGYPQYHKTVHRKYYYPHSPHNPNIIGHRLPDSLSPYDRSTAGPQGSMAYGEDLRYAVRRVYPSPIGGGYPGANSDGNTLESPHRIRVMSEQQVNTFNQFSGSPAGGLAYYHPTEMSHPEGRQKYMRQSFSHAEEMHQYGVHRHKKSFESPNLTSNRPSAEFTENQINFKTQFPKDSNSPHQGSGKIHRSSRGSPVEGYQEQEMPQKLHVSNKKVTLNKIIELEEEIKATKDKLKMLENLHSKYKREYETVEEAKSHNESNSDSINNE